MIVYAESNFVLELALGQEESSAVDELLTLAEQRHVTLVLPGFSLSEPYATLTQRERSRTGLRSTLSEQLRQLRRSVPRKDAAAALEPLLDFLRGLDREEFTRLATVVGRVLRIARLVPFDIEVFGDALAAQDRFELSPQDAIVYASVLQDLRASNLDEHKLFVSRNWRDFNYPGIIEELHRYGCRYEESYDAALRDARANLA